MLTSDPIMPPSGKGFLVENQIMLMSDIAVVLSLCAFLTGFETGSCVAAFKKQRCFRAILTWF